MFLSPNPLRIFSGPQSAKQAGASIMEDMDVDIDLPSSPFASSSTEKLYLPPNQLTALNNEMKENQRRYTLQTIERDVSQWLALFAVVLQLLTTALASTDLKHRILQPSTLKQAENFVNSFNTHEFREFKDGVMKGLREGNWEDLISHSRLRDPNTTQRSIRFTTDTPDQQAERLHQMFHLTYRGNAVEDFIRGIQVYEKIYNPEWHFGRTIPILQSSGTGKSRLVHEMGHVVPTLSICLRESDLPEAGWPPNDEPARRFLLKQRSIKYKGEELAAAFLGAMMHVVSEKLSHRLCTSTSSSPKDWMSDWQLDTPTDIANSSRQRCFTEVEAIAENLLINNRLLIESRRISTPLLGSDEPTTSAADWHIQLFELLCLSHFENLALVLKNQGMKYFILAFDECSQLNTNTPSPNPDQPPSLNPLWHMSLIALQRIIKAYDALKCPDVTFWFLILDTNSSVFDMVPHGRNAPSRRLTKGFIPLPPWPYLGFNQMVKKGIATRIKMPTDVLTMRHLKVYGRPYWSILTDREAPIAANEKLFSLEGFDPQNEDHVLAAFAVRAGLEIGESEAAERLSMEAVRSHMRILKGVVGRLVITTSPSEPMLAIAAAEALNSSEEIYQKAMETLLDKLILRGLVLDRGLLGEFGSRLLLLRTRDKATTLGGKTFMDVDQEWVPTVQAVRLSEFLKTLLGDDLSLPVNQGVLREQLLEKASQVWLNFTHFVQLSMTIDEVTPSMLLEAWSSGSAFQCAFNQAVIDGFLVAYYGRLDKPFNASNLFVLPWQTKAKSDAAELALARALTAPFLVNPDDSMRTKPWHVAILMDLAASSAFGKATGPHCDLTWGKAERPNEKRKGGNWGGYARQHEVEGERYCLNIRGHRAVTYPVLKGVERQFNDLFQRMLGCVEPGLEQFADAMEDAMERVKLD